MCIHLRLEDPGTDGAVLAVHVGLPHLVDGLLGPEPQHLVGGHLHVGLALLSNLPLLVHHLLQVLQEGPWQAAGIPSLCVCPGYLPRVLVPDRSRWNVLGDGWRVR